MMNGSAMNARKGHAMKALVTNAVTKVRTFGLILLCLCFAAAAAAQSKGNGRINGKILDDQGKPAPNVQVRATRAGDALVLEAKTNDKGEWSMQNMVAGQYNFEFVKDGFDPQRVQVQVADNRNPPIEMKLTKVVAVDPNVELQEGMKKAAALQQEGKNADARKIIEDLLAKYPAAYRLNAFIATSYEAEKNYDKAIEHMKIVTEKEPTDIDLKMYLAELLTAKGDKVEAQKILDAVDMTQVKDATVFINMAIGSINAQKGDEAVALLDKVSKQFPTRADVYYYRARANIVSKKMAEAKADLEKFISMAAPDARELADAKKLLEQLKDVK
jgi:predicted Zn-dependent protease